MKKPKKKVSYRKPSKRNFLQDVQSDAGRQAKNRVAEKNSENDLRAALDYPKNGKGNRYGVSIRTIESLMAEKKIPFLRLTRKLVRFPVLEVDAYFSRNLRVNAIGDDGGAR